MKALRVGLLLAMPLGLGACAPPQVPIPAAYSPTLQQKMQAAYHWDVLAASVAQRLQGALGNRDTKGQPLVLNVKEPPDNTVFNQAFRDLLITELMQQGFGISRDPNVGIPVSYEVQVITHRDRGLNPHATDSGPWIPQDGGFNDRNYPRPAYPSMPGQPQYSDNSFTYYAMGPVPDSEVIVTTSVLGGQRFVTRMSDIYYISDNNRDQYLAKARPATRLMEVVGQ